MQHPRSRRAPGRTIPELAIAITSVAALLAFSPLGACRDARAQGHIDGVSATAPGFALPPSPLRPRSAYVPFDADTYRYVGPGIADRSTYRTLCVRHCDGYYWPVSNAVSRSRFYRDADACRESCSAEASLYYHPVDGGTDDMVDLMGRSYASLPAAFQYRKSLVHGCTCRPQPWSESEFERHRAYTPIGVVQEDGPAESPAALAPGSTESSGRFSDKARRPAAP